MAANNPDWVGFKQILDKNVLYATYSRKAIYRKLLATKKPVSMERLVISLSDELDRSTVYRNIDLFEKIGIVKKIYTGWKYRIELSDKFKPHHHHLTCNNCGKIFPFELGPKIEQAIENLGQKQNFKITNHDLEIHGLCKNCQKSSLV